MQIPVACPQHTVPHRGRKGGCRDQKARGILEAEEASGRQGLVGEGCRRQGRRRAERRGPAHASPPADRPRVYARAAAHLAADRIGRIGTHTAAESTQDAGRTIKGWLSWLSSARSLRSEGSAPPCRRQGRCPAQRRRAADSESAADRTCLSAGAAADLTDGQLTTIGMRSAAALMQHAVPNQGRKGSCHG